MKKLVLIFTFIFAAISCVGGSLDDPTFQPILFETNSSGLEIYTGKFYLLDGTVGDSPVTMYLDLIRDGDNGVYSKYYNNNTGKFIYGYGSCISNEIDIKEYIIDGSDILESFKGNISKEGVFTGVSESLGTNYSFDFNPYGEPILSEANFITVVMITNRNIGESDYSFYFQKTSIMAFEDNTNMNSVIEKLNGRDSQKDSLVSYITNYAEKIYSDWNGMFVESGGETIGVNSEMYLNDSITYADGEVASFLRKEYIYNGGAHGNTTVIPLLYSVKTSDAISAKSSDLLVNVRDKKFIELLNKKLLEDRKRDNFFDFRSITPGSFYITPYGITFLWNRYDIAPYSEGLIEVSFSFEELKPFVKNTSPLFYLFQ